MAVTVIFQPQKHCLSLIIPLVFFSPTLLFSLVKISYFCIQPPAADYKSKCMPKQTKNHVSKVNLKHTFSFSLCVLWLSMSAHTHFTYVTSPVSCTKLCSVVLPWKEQQGWEVFWPLPSTFFNVYLTHARTPLPPYSHVRAEYYENTITLTHILLQVVTI